MKKSIQLQRLNITDVKEFLGESFVNIIIERHPSGKVEIEFKNSENGISKIQLGDYIVKTEDGQLCICDYNPFENEFHAKNK